MEKFRYIIYFFVLLCLTIYLGCGKSSTEPKPTGGKINGSVSNAQSGNMLVNQQAWIFNQDSLIATTNNDGSFSWTVKKDGAYQLLCSALGYLDATIQVQVSGGKASSCTFSLTPDTRTGRIYGEFQDMNLFIEKAAAKPELNNWNSKETWEGVTGATLMSNNLLYKVPVRSVVLGDSTLVPSDTFPSDDWGQYWMDLQQGTYYLKATCEGYKDAGRVVTIYPDSTQYINFYLYRQ